MTDQIQGEKCPSCGLKISSDTTRCPYCGKDIRSWLRRYSVLTAVLGFLAITFFLGRLSSVFYNEDRSQRTDQEDGQSSQTQEYKQVETQQTPVKYEVGYTSGFLAAISVPQGTTKEQLKELLSYFHSLNEKGKLSQVMGGHTVIDIFDDKKWTVEGNYNSLVWDQRYCDYVRATYSVDIHGVERASIGQGDCSNYEEVIF